MHVGAVASGFRCSAPLRMRPRHCGLVGRPGTAALAPQNIQTKPGDTSGALNSAHRSPCVVSGKAGVAMLARQEHMVMRGHLVEWQRLGMRELDAVLESKHPYEHVDKRAARHRGLIWGLGSTFLDLDSGPGKAKDTSTLCRRIQSSSRPVLAPRVGGSQAQRAFSGAKSGVFAFAPIVCETSACRFTPRSASGGRARCVQEAQHATTCVEKTSLVWPRREKEREREKQRDRDGYALSSKAPSHPNAYSLGLNEPTRRVALRTDSRHGFDPHRLGLVRDAPTTGAPHRSAQSATRYTHTHTHPTSGTARSSARRSFACIVTRRVAVVDEEISLAQVLRHAALWCMKGRGCGRWGGAYR